MTVIDALKLGWRSLGDDAARAAMGHEAAEAMKTASINNAVGRGVSGQELAELYPQIQSNAENFLKDFHAAYKQPTFDSMPESLAYGASRKVSGVASGANQMVQGLGGIPGVALQAAFIAPMFMGGGGQEQPQQPELQPYEQEALARAQMREMRRQQMMQQQQQGQYQ